MNNFPGNRCFPYIFIVAVIASRCLSIRAWILQVQMLRIHYQRFNKLVQLRLTNGDKRESGYAVGAVYDRAHSPLEEKRAVIDRAYSRSIRTGLPSRLEISIRCSL